MLDTNYEKLRLESIHESIICIQYKQGRFAHEPYEFLTVPLIFFKFSYIENRTSSCNRP